jgi:hypothetical protein
VIKTKSLKILSATGLTSLRADCPLWRVWVNVRRAVHPEELKGSKSGITSNLNYIGTRAPAGFVLGAGFQVS